MKSIHTHPFLNIFTLFALLTSMFGSAIIASPVRAAENDAGLPVSQLLNLDGTLDLHTGYSGNLDIADYGVRLDPLHGPVFTPLAVPIGWGALNTNNTLNGVVNAIGVDNFGQVILGGAFTDANLPILFSQNADYIAQGCEVLCQEMGTTPFNGIVNAIFVSGTDVYVGGVFTNAGGVAAADRIAKWSGGAWSALGTGLDNGAVRAIAISGLDVYAGGTFTDVGGNANVDNIAKFSGGAWSALGTGLNGFVNAIAISGADVYAGGTFTDAGAVANADKIAKFSGGAWSALGAGLSSDVQAIAISGADVYAGGFFLDAGGDVNADYIARFSGGAWSTLGSTPLNGGVFAIALSGGNVYAGGIFTDAGGDATADFIAKFNGSAWSALEDSSPLNAAVLTIVISGSVVYAGGGFTNANGVATADYVAKWDISPTWDALGSTPLSHKVNAVIISGSDVYAGGDFITAGGVVNANRIAKWNGTTWSALGTGITTGTTVNAIAISGTDVYIGGQFTSVGGVANTVNIAKFSGGVWSALGTGLNGIVNAIGINGTDVYAGGAFTDAGGVVEADKIAKFSGGAWSALGNNGAGVGALNNTVNAIAISGTDVYAGGNFTDAGGVAEADKIAKFSGGAWSSLGSVPMAGIINAIAISGGDVYAGGTFNNAGLVAEADNIAKFSGGVWSALGSNGSGNGALNNTVNAIAIRGGEVYAGGNFTDAGGDVNADFIARFSDGTWSVLISTPLSALVNDIAISGKDLYAGGQFLNAGGDPNADFIARFEIPPTVSSITLANANPTAAASVNFTVTFSEPVIGVDTADFALTAVTVSGASVTAVTPVSTSVYTVTVNTGSGNGTLRLDIIVFPGIENLTANALVGPYTSGAVYTINKTLTYKSVGAQDGWILESSENSTAGGTLNATATTFNLGDDAADKQYRAILSFNTASLPDNAVITKVTLKIKKQGLVGTDPFTILGGLKVDMRKPFFGPAIGLAIGDFQAAAGKSNVATFGITPVSNWYSALLNAAGQVYLNKTGATQFRLRFATDDNDNTTADFMKFFSGSATASARPTLIVEYYVP